MSAAGEKVGQPGWDSVEVAVVGVLLFTVVMSVFVGTGAGGAIVDALGQAVGTFI